MSFLAGLLRRELTSVPSATGALAGTTPAAAVVPRLASRFEAPGLPWWPGPGQQEASREGHEDTGLHPDNGPSDAAPNRRGDHSPDTSAPRNPSSTNTDAGVQRLVGGSVAKVGMQPSRGEPSHGGRATNGDSRLEATEAGGMHGDARPTVQPPPVVAAAVPAALRLDPPASESRRQTFLFPMAGEEGHPGRVAGVVNGLERTGDHSPAAHSKGDGRAEWQGRTEGQVRPRLEPLARRESAKAPEQHIHVSIGRIEVKAVAATAPQPTAPGRAGLMSLDEYLRGRP